MAGRQEIRIRRFLPEAGDGPRYQTFQVEASEATTVLDALITIKDYQDGSLTFRCSCRQGICGSCAMRINDRERLACMTRISHLVSSGSQLTVAPLANLPVLKDLVVDMQKFWKRYLQIKPYLMPDPTKPKPVREYLVSQKQTRNLQQFAACIQCGSCYSACPIEGTDERYIGPAALAKAYRLTADPRDGARVERLRIVSEPHGIWRCHTIFNCTEVCPVGVDPTDAIERLKTMVIRDHFRLPSRRASRGDSPVGGSGNGDPAAAES